MSGFLHQFRLQFDDPVPTEFPAPLEDWGVSYLEGKLRTRTYEKEFPAPLEAWVISYRF